MTDGVETRGGVWKGADFFSDTFDFWALLDTEDGTEWHIDRVGIFYYGRIGKWVPKYVDYGPPAVSGRSRSEAVLKFRIAHPTEKLYDFGRNPKDKSRDFDTQAELMAQIKEIRE